MKVFSWLENLKDLSDRGIPHVLATIVSTTGSSPRETGAKLIYVSAEEFYGTVGGGRLEQLCLEECLQALKHGTSYTKKFPLGAMTGQCCGGSVEIFFEILGFGPKIYIFGAGHVGQALARTLLGTPFTATFIDDRQMWLDRLPKKVLRISETPRDALEEIPKDDNTFFLIMTHRHDWDQEILEKLITTRNFSYLGLIGSRSKWERFKARLKQKNISEKLWEKVSCPVGINLGLGKRPQEVAISIAAELLQKHYQSQNK